MALVENVNKPAIHSKTGLPFIMSFGKNQFLVPESAVRSFPKKANKSAQLCDGKALGAALATKAPERWMGYCNPDTLMHIEGLSGESCVYTTFDIPGHPDEARFLHHISGPIAFKNFPEWKQAVEKGITEGTIPPREEWNERLTRRYAVLDWTKEVDCPERNQLHPELNKWVSVTKDGGELVKSCRIAPETKRRPKGPNDKRAAEKRKRGIDDDDDVACDPDEAILWRRSFKVGPKGSYTVKEFQGKLHIVQYKHEEKEATDGGAAETEEAHENDEYDEVEDR